MKKILIAALIQFLVVVPITSASKAQEAAKFDRFENINCEYEKARLDSFAVQLQNQPDAIGYIVFYGGRKYGMTGHTHLPRHNEGEARVARLKSYLIGSRGLDPKQLVLVNGGYRETWQAELWVVPKGANPPILAPTLKPAQIKFRKGVAREKDYQCEI
jgi:hypothetical protein